VFTHAKLPKRDLRALHIHLRLHARGLRLIGLHPSAFDVLSRHRFQLEQTLRALECRAGVPRCGLVCRKLRDGFGRFRACRRGLLTLQRHEWLIARDAVTNAYVDGNDSRPSGRSEASRAVLIRRQLRRDLDGVCHRGGSHGFPSDAAVLDLFACDGHFVR
jgi:hypothetical protein